MEAHDVRAALDGQPIWTTEDGTVSFWRLASFNDGMVWVGRYSGESPWERHLDADEFLYVVEGEFDVIVLTDGRPVETTVRAGSIFVVPRERWHKQVARGWVTQLGVTTGRVEHSTADYPGRES
jgi:mannose-6-phosphate isomerase-like protein (cupin superfamily)